jgi:carbamate kinase
VVKLDWSNVASPSMMAIKEVVGGAVGTAINNGRVYVPAGGGGLAVLK